MKLQGDIFKSAKPGETTTFEGAFPTIKTVNVVIKEEGQGTEGLGLRALTRRSVRETINCSNPRCFGKGLDLGGLMRKMVHAGETTHTVEIVCGSRHRRFHACCNVFYVQLAITYKSI